MKLNLMTALLLCLAAPALAKPPAVAKAPAAPAKVAAVDAVPAKALPGQSGDPQKFVAGMYDRLNLMTQQAQTLVELHKSIGQELQGVVDYSEMARLTLGQKWTEITEPQKKEFTELLSRMVLNTYVKRFKPGSPVAIAWTGVRTPAAGKAIVATTIKVQKTSADVEYALLMQSGRWMVYDIVVDDASQVQTYRQSFKKVLDRDGWEGLIKRMKKAADKKVE